MREYLLRIKFTGRVSFIIVGNLEVSLYAGTTIVKSNNCFLSVSDKRNGFSSFLRSTYFPFSNNIYLQGRE